MFFVAPSPVTHPRIWPVWWTSWRFGRFVHGFGRFGGKVSILAGLSTDLAFLVDKLAFCRVCPRIWRFWWMGKTVAVEHFCVLRTGFGAYFRRRGRFGVLRTEIRPKSRPWRGGEVSGWGRPGGGQGVWRRCGRRSGRWQGRQCRGPQT